jgi:Na+(H+)/acetate symporter ActP
MTLELSDWLIVALYFIASAGIALIYTRRASQSLDEYFVSGRALPWWLAGTSMVATTFAADTPLVVAGLVARYGVAGNWLWWNGALSGILTVFFFARLWRRAGVLTDLEFAELRYGGKPAAVLRGFRALYLALPVNLIIMGWVTRAMVTILHITLAIDPWTAAILLFAVTGTYSIFSGLWGVVVTDTFQFIVKMGGVIVLAIYAVNSVGGLDSMVRQVTAHFGSYEAAFGVLPPVDKCSGGQRGIPGRSPGAAATWHSASSPPKTNATDCLPRCGSRSPTTPCAPGPGFWWASWRCCDTPTWPIPRKATSGSWWTYFLRRSRDSSSPPLPPHT